MNLAQAISVKVGSTNVTAMYLGSTKIYPLEPVIMPNTQLRRYHMIIDDFKGDEWESQQEKYDYLDDYFTLANYDSTGNRYTCIGTFKYDSTYYIWECDNPNDGSGNKYYILTYDYLLDYTQTVRYNYDNENCVVAGFITLDSNDNFNMTYIENSGIDLTGRFLFFDYQVSTANHYIAIDDLPIYKEDYDYEVSESDYLQNYYLPNVLTISNIYKYTGTYTYNSNQYYLWEYVDNHTYVVGGTNSIPSNLKYLLTQSNDFTGLTVRDNVSNRNCPIFAILADDFSLTYDQTQISTRDHVILIDEWYE